MSVCAEQWWSVALKAAGVLQVTLLTTKHVLCGKSATGLQIPTQNGLLPRRSLYTIKCVKMNERAVGKQKILATLLFVGFSLPPFMI